MQVDDDNSGAIDFFEFLLLAIPGMSKVNSSKKPRNFTINAFRNAMFEDADQAGRGEGEGDMEIPEQCFVMADEVADDDSRAKVLFAELRIRFKRNVHDTPGRSESARDGNIVLPLTLKRDCWVERIYPFEDKAPEQGSGGAGESLIGHPFKDPKPQTSTSPTLHFLTTLNSGYWHREAQNLKPKKSEHETLECGPQASSSLPLRLQIPAGSPCHSPN